MRWVQRACGPFFVLAGAMHFLKPRMYRQIMPPALPAPTALVYLSGVAEAVGGAALMRPSTRRWAGWWLTATLIAIFPANVQMAMHPDVYKDVPGGRPALFARLPFQGLFIWWVLASSRRNH
jgi:uncharacterized membrane protein